MPNWFESLVTPETAILQAQMQSVDTHLADLERLGGSAVQESREDLRRRRSDIISLMGRYGGTSNDIDKMLTGVENQQKGFEDSTSMDISTQQANAARMRAQLAQIIPIRRAQETFGAVKDVAGSAAQVAGAFIPGVGPLVSAAGAAVAGNDVGEAMGGAQGFQDWRGRQRYGSPAAAEASPTGIYAEPPPDRQAIWERYLTQTGRR